MIEGLLQTKWYELVAVISGIVSVWLNRKENILVYPIGLVNTILYIFISLKGHLIGEAAVNLYYSIVSIYGWLLWAKKDAKHRPVLHITFSSPKQWLHQVLFFLFFYVAIYSCLSYLKKEFAPGALPAADAFASATAFTGMWLTARKKIESWHWYIASNIASIPLYYVKGLLLTSAYFVVLLVLAVAGLTEWIKRARTNDQANSNIGSGVNRQKHAL